MADGHIPASEPTRHWGNMVDIDFVHVWGYFTETSSTTSFGSCGFFALISISYKWYFFFLLINKVMYSFYISIQKSINQSSNK